MKTTTQKLVERFAPLVLERVAPGAGQIFREVLEVIEGADGGRAPLPMESSEPLEPSGPEQPVIEGDTIAVEITDERGRVVGWTIAKVGARKP